MKPDSRTIIHLGINFLLTPFPGISSQAILSFQQALLANGLEYSQILSEPTKFTLIRQQPTHLQVVVNTVQPSQIGQLLIIADHPGRPPDLFIQEAEAVQQAFLDTWSSPVYQIVSCDVSLRELHETTSEHAFKELWENRLHQPPESLAPFGRPLLGGGLRFVFPPLEGEIWPAQIEVKIESFLTNTNKLFIETNFGYPQPMQPVPADQDPFSIRNRITEADRFAVERVCVFVKGG